MLVYNRSATCPIYSAFDNEIRYILASFPLFFKPYPQIYQIDLFHVQNYVPVTPILRVE